MRQQSFLPVFFLFLFLSFMVFFLSQKNLLFGSGILGNGLFAIQGVVYSTIHILPQKQSDLDKLRQENTQLKVAVTQLKTVEDDNKALRDQFQTTSIPSQNLLPAAIIGEPGFFPGISLPESVVIDKGNKDGVNKGDITVVKNIVIGQIFQITNHASLVTLITNTASSITAQAQQTGALGIVKGMGNGQLVLDNVALSDQLKVGDTVVTSPGQNPQGIGFSPGLLLGEITSIEKKPSSLFQKAYLKTFLQIEKVRLVFILQAK